MEHLFFNQLFPANTTQPIIHNRLASDANDTLITTTSNPLGLLLYNGFLYVTHYNIQGNGTGTYDNTITKINLSDNSETTWITADKGLQGPTSIIMYNGYIYVGNLAGFISKISLDDNNPTIDNTWFTLPHPTIFDILEYNGYFYVTGDEFGRFDISTKTYQTLVSQSDGYYMTLDSNFIYIAGPFPKKYNLLTGTSEDLSINIQAVKFIIYNNTLYGTNFGTNTIDEINLTTNTLTQWKSTGSFPVNIINNTNYFYTSNFQNSSISRLVLPGGGAGGGGAGGGGGGGGGSTDHFFVNESFTISQTANIYSNNLPYVNTDIYDYILDININGVWNSMNDLFEERRFMTETTYNDVANYDYVHLNVNREKLAGLLETSNTVLISSTQTSIIASHSSVYGTLSGSAELTGFRFLEMVATKIFGHAKTKIAIENADEYYVNDYVDANTTVSSLIGQIAKGIFNSVTNLKHELMNEYIQTDRIEDNSENAVLTDINGYPRPFMYFNFNDTVWEFPIVFHTDLATTGDDTINELNNGPDVGGARLANGSVDVPVLLRFSA